MASGTAYNPAAFDTVFGTSQSLGQDGKNLMRQAMSPRQVDLTRRYQFAKTRQYDGRTVAWDGSRAVSSSEAESATMNGHLPPGYLDAASGSLEDMPYHHRKPKTRYGLVGLVVNRFTGLLFGEGMSPEAKVPGYEDTQEWINGLLEAACFWQRWQEARFFGGSMGAVAVGFRFVSGRPVIEVHDPRWCTPTFKDKATGELTAIKIRYMYPVDVPTKDGKTTEQVMHWYRRIIDVKNDVVMKPAKVDPDGKEPIWEADQAQTITHAFGFCPVRWVQNLPQSAAVDGEPDCDDGVLVNVEAIDELMSHAVHGTGKNCDPTLHVATEDQTLPELRKGSGNAIRTEVGGVAAYVEMTGSGVKTAVEIRKELKAESLEMAECVLQAPDVAGKTATEIQRAFEAMFAKARKIRQQYATCGIKPLIEDMLRAARALDAGAVEEGAATMYGQPVPGSVKRVVALPPIVKDGTLVSRTMGEGTFVELSWPDFISPSPVDAQACANAATTALQGGVISQETAVAYVGPQFKVTNQDDELKKIRTEKAAQLLADTTDFLDAGAPPTATVAPEPQKGPLDDVTVNEITLAIQRLAQTGDITSVNMMRRVLAAKFGQPYPGDMTAEALSALATAAQPAAPPAPAGGFPFGG